MLTRRIALVAVAGQLLLVMALAGSGPAVAESGGPAASGAQAGLVSYVGPKRLKARKRFRYGFVCSADCVITARAKLILKGPDLGPLSAAAGFAAGQPGAHVLKLNRAALRRLRSKRKSARLKTKVQATDLSTGATQTIRRTFRFKR